MNRPVTTPQIETGYLNGGGRGGNPKPGVVGMMREDEGAVGMMGKAWTGMMGETVAGRLHDRLSKRGSPHPESRLV